MLKTLSLEFYISSGKESIVPSAKRVSPPLWYCGCSVTLGSSSARPFSFNWAPFLSFLVLIFPSSTHKEIVLTFVVCGQSHCAFCGRPYPKEKKNPLLSQSRHVILMRNRLGETQKKSNVDFSAYIFDHCKPTRCNSLQGKPQGHAEQGTYLEISDISACLSIPTSFSSDSFMRGTNTC